jgi:hypothetical protein
MRSMSQFRSLGAAAVLATLLLPAIPTAAQESGVLPWPRQLDGEQGQIVIYQPQFEEYSGDALKARAAVSVTPQGQSAPVFGAIWFDARIATDTDARTASLESIVVTDARFPDSTTQEGRLLAGYVEEEVPKWEMVISMDSLIAGLAQLEGSQRGVSDLDNSPPRIIYASEPTVLVTVDGDPILDDLENSGLEYVVNTPFYILLDPDTGRYFLYGGGHWYTAGGILDEWQVASSLPPKVSAVARDVEAREQKREETLSTDPRTADPALSLADVSTPRVVVSTVPAEVIQTDGEPQFAPIEGTNLLYLQNSESDIIMYTPTQRYYILLSGRWYTSGSLSGTDWTFVAPDFLPADFYRIPADSEMGDVRASIAGTDEAADAVAENLIPQTAEVDRGTATVTVTYDGDPEFVLCSGDVAYAANADKAVLLVGNTYYCCDNAVWFVSNYPDGPWLVATEVPAEIQDLPPSCPYYNVRYVYIYDVTPDIIYVGYTPGYLGSYVYRGCVVYGTGYWYHPWHRHHYYPRFATWGYGAHWRPYTGWGFYFGISFGWLDLWFDRPWYTGWWGPCGYVYGYRHGYYHGHHNGYHGGYHHGDHDGYWDSEYAGYHPAQHPGAGSGNDERNLFRKHPKGILLPGGEHVVSTGGEAEHRTPHALEPVPGTPMTPPHGQGSGQVPVKPERPPGNVTIVGPTKHAPRPAPGTPLEAKKPRKAPEANDIYAAPDGKVYKEHGGKWQKVEKSKPVRPRQAGPADNTQEELNRARKARDRGEALENKAKPRSRPEVKPAKPAPRK